MKRKFLFTFVFLFAVYFSFSEDTSIDGIYRCKLENGLEVFVAENDSAPLAYIELAVRAGSVTQTPENAGLFHLYEHMLFKGNEKYENQDAFTEAANEMGRIAENGSTGVDRVNYFFTVPSSQVRNGLEFWSYAIRTPKLDEQELENEKSVVLSEISADFTNPSRIISAAIHKNMFASSPWRTDPSGSPKIVKNATVDDLKKMQKQYYIPENSAIFIGGDVNHEEVFQYVREIYGDWENPAVKTKIEPPPAKNPLSKDKKLIFVNPENSDKIIQISYYLRGPDGEIDSADTYAADVWSSVMNRPDGIFANILLSEKSLDIPESDYTGVSFPTRRASSLLGFHAAMLNLNNDSKNSPAAKSDKFISVIKTKVMQAMLNKNQFFGDKGIDFVIQQLENSRIYDLESAEGILSSLSFFWSSCGADYFFTYDENISRVTEDDVVSFVKKYIQNKNGLLVVSVSPEIWKNYKNEFSSLGYEEVKAEDSFWHKNF